MPLTLLVGDDTYAIQTHLEQLKTLLDPAWRSLNVQTFEAATLNADALNQLLRRQIYPTACSRLSFSSGKILVVKTAAQVCVALEASEAYQSGLD